MAFDPSNMYDKQEGTTILPAQTTTPKVLTKEIQFKTDGSFIEGVSHDYTSNRYTTVPSSFALYEALNRFQKNLDALDPNHNFYKDNSVVTLPLIDPNFSQTEEIPWKIKGWMIVDGQAVYQGVGDNENYLRIPTDVFTFPSYYHLNVIVDRLDSGTVRVYDHLDRLVLEADKMGEYNVEMFIGEPDVTTLRIVAENVFVGDVVRLDAVNLHLVTDRFRDYFVAMLKAGDLVIGVDEKEATQIANNIANNLFNALRATVINLEDDLTAHVAQKNAHGVTCEMIGAATENHTHTAFGVISQDLDDFSKHVQTVTGNPHQVTYEEVGAAPLEHVHTPSECDAAAADHDHDGRYLPMDALDNIDEIISDILAAKEGSSGSDAAFLISSVGSWGVPAPASQDTELWRPAVLLRFPYNLHMASGDYDYQSGYARCNVLPIEGNAGRAFSEYWGETAKFNVVPGPTNPVKLEYTFHTDRGIKGYKIYKSTAADCVGYAASWSLKVDGVEVDSVADASWSTLSQGTKTECFEKSLPESVSAEIVLLEVTGVNVDTDGKWGIRIEFIFDDVPSSESTVIGAIDMIVTRGIQANFLKNSHDNLSSSDCKLTLTTLPTEDSPLWLSVKRSVNYEPESQFTWVQHQLQPDTVEPSYSQFQRGVDSMMGKFASASHPLWGTIAASSMNASYPVKNIYSKEDNFFLSEASSLVVLTHTFQHDLPASGITGLGFKWSQKLIDQNWVPKSLRVTMEGTFENDEGDKVAGAKKVLDLPTLDIWQSVSGPGYLYLEELWGKKDQMSNVTSIKLELNYNGNRPSQTAIGLSEFRVFMCGWWASPINQECSNVERMPFGRLERVVCPSSSLLTNAVQHVGYPLNKIMGIPIENFDYILPGTYQVPNPFTTTDVNVSVFTNEKTAGTSSETTATYNLSAATVSEVTTENIKVNVNVPGRYGLKVIRQW